MTANSRTLRIFPVIRSAHIDDLNGPAPRPMMFFGTVYEAADLALPPDWEQKSLVGVLRRLWTDPPSSLELFEPTWFFFRWLAIAFVFKVRTRGTGSTLGFYAIQNGSIAENPPGHARLRPMTRPFFAHVLRLLLTMLVDRIVFGTDAAAAAYADVVGGVPETTVIHDLRRPRVEAGIRKQPGSVAFVGVLEVRKGLPELMKIWPEVEAQNPDAHLEIVGDGTLHQQAVAWVEQQPNSRSFRGRIPHSDVISTLSRTEILVLPSQRVKGWREQVGLGIVEALACGCTVVTTDETGVAAWLTANGHYVIPADQTGRRLAPSVVAALGHPIPPAAVLASLPDTDGRVRADAWLHRPV